MDISINTIIAVCYVFCYFAFGLKGAAGFIDRKMGKLLQDTQKYWLRYLLIPIIALFFAFIECTRIILLLMFRIVQFILEGFT